MKFAKKKKGIFTRPKAKREEKEHKRHIHVLSSKKKKRHIYSFPSQVSLTGQQEAKRRAPSRRTGQQNAFSEGMGESIPFPPPNLLLRRLPVLRFEISISPSSSSQLISCRKRSSGRTAGRGFATTGVAPPPRRAGGGRFRVRILSPLICL